MAKVRLNQQMRNRLCKKVEEFVDLLVDKPDTESQLELVRAGIHDAIKKQCPPADMKVLKKYKRTVELYRVTLVRETFVDPAQGGDSHQDVTILYSHNLHQIFGQSIPEFYVSEIGIHEADTIVLAYKKFLADVESYEREKKDRALVYYRLINGARYYEEIIDVWPIAAEWQVDIVPAAQLPATITRELRETIHKDMQHVRTKQNS